MKKKKQRKKDLLATFFLIGCALFSLGAYYFLASEKKTNILDGREVEIENIEQSGLGIMDEIEEEILENDAENLQVIELDEESETETENPAIEVGGLEVDESLIGDNVLFPARAFSVPKVKRNDPDEIRIGFITDLHVRSDADEIGNRYFKQRFTDRINYFVEKMNDDFVPNFILVDGDLIEGTNVSPDKGFVELSLIKQLFDQTILSKYWVIGNHDLRSVNKEQFKKALDIDYTSKAFEVGNYKIIILDSNFDENDEDIVPGEYYTRGHLSQYQINFLENESKNTDKRVLVFVHHPILWDMNGLSNNKFPDNTLKVREIFSENSVLGVFSGHIEDLFFGKMDGVNYFVSPGIEKNEKYQGTFCEITIKKSKITIEMTYLKKGKYKTVKIEREE